MKTGKCKHQLNNRMVPKSWQLGQQQKMDVGGESQEICEVSLSVLEINKA